ncbi:MAG: tRNA uridine-5-carboxymethylaminomethyl(34) synthesis GTPase MnmE [Rickettsiales bacterium]|nr:tRNA uridine-5-carboxymethylaminomethyl(34) synthesis GTPase MnmE [Rickettsiales bacterium]
MFAEKYKVGDTIFAPASSVQKSGIIVVRVSGPNTHKVPQLLGFKNLEIQKASLVTIHHPKTNILIDKAIVTFFKAPHSFTGEDVLEISIHGSKIVLKLLCDALSYLENSRFAEAGEFSMRAFINNKMDLTQIEGLADLLDAETELQHTKAISQMSGQLTDLYENWRKSLIRTESLIEAYLDFPDEDIPQHVLSTAQNNIDNLKKDIKRHIEISKRGDRIHEGLLVTIIGPTNSGKSSLINTLSKRDIAIVSNIEGTTRDTIETFLNITGYPIILADTAGLRNSTDTIEMEGIKRSISKATDADINIIMFDGTTDYKNEKQTLEMLSNKSILVFNKYDIMSEQEKAKIPPEAICISTKNNHNIEKLINTISDKAQLFFEHTDEPIITRERYKQNLLQCLEYLEDFDFSKDLVLAAEDLRLAASYLSRITGRIDVESILDEIFSSFCIGK